MLFSRQQANEFFDAWRRASIAIMDYYSLPLDPGRKVRPWKHGRPIGVTEHFTGGITWKETVRWLNGQDNDKASCHALILDRRIAEIDDIWSQYPILQQIPVTALLLADLSQGTWHAGWVNALNFGIENRNAGILKGRQGAWTWWVKKWTAPFPHQGLGKTPIRIDGMWWEPFTYGQVVANIIICQMLFSLYHSNTPDEPSMDARWFLPHSATEGTKWDTGRAFPLSNVRDAVFDQAPVESLQWLQSFKADPMYMNDYGEGIDDEFLEALTERQGCRDADTPEDLDTCGEVPSADLQVLIQDGDWKKELPSIRRGLHMLGYRVGFQSLYGFELDDDTAVAIYQFQRSVKLQADKIPGDKTQKALMRRIKDFGLV